MLLLWWFSNGDSHLSSVTVFIFYIFIFIFLTFIEGIGMTLVNKIISVSGVHFYNTTFF